MIGLTPLVIALSGPPRDVRLAIEEMGQPCFACRERGSRRLKRACESGDWRAKERALGWACRGLDHPDPEVRMRCRWVLGHAKPWACARCEGRGWRGKFYEKDGSLTIDVCEACKGAGTVWPVPGRRWEWR